MAQIVFFTAVAISMLIVLGNSFQMKYQENIERRQQLMKKEKLEQIANAMSGLSYREFEEVASRIEASYHVTKKELTSEEISSVIKNIH